MTLLKLARERFGKLEKTEKKLFSDIEDRGQADFCDDWTKLDPSTADLPELRAECVAWLLTDRKAGELISHRGVTVVGARLTGVLDASFARFPWQFGLIGCHVPEGVVLQDASVHSLDLSGSHVKEVKGDGMCVAGDVSLCKNFVSCKDVRLPGASIGGDLACVNSSFLKTGRDALHVEGIRIAGNIFFSGARMEGRVEFGMSSVLNGFKLSGNQWGHGSLLSLMGTSVGVLYDGKGAWPAKGNLLVNGFTYERLQDKATKNVAERLAWLDLQPDDEYRPQPYEQLAAVYARNGFGSQARKVLIAKNDKLLWFYRHRSPLKLGKTYMAEFLKAQGDARINAAARLLPDRFKAETDRLPKHNWGRHFWHWFLGKCVGYGYRPQRLLYIALGMVALGWLLFGLGGQGAMVPAPDGAQGYPRFHALIYSLDTFLPLVDLEQKSRWVPDGRVWCLGWYQVLHILMGWFLTTMGVAALIDRLKR